MNAEKVNDDEREEAQQISSQVAMEEAEALLRTRKDAVLCTLSAKVEGWPFGSVVPFAIDREGRPIILIASIAEHTRNVKADPRVSLFVQAGANEAHGDVQTLGRLTLMGRAERVPPEALDDARARYLAVLPDAADYFGTHSFAFYRISVERLRYIGGFGKIFWLDSDKYRARIQEDPLLKKAAGIVAHMNEDHTDALALYCQAFKGIEVEGVTMTGVDRWGLDVRCETPPSHLRFDFQKPATPDTIRSVVVEMVQVARKQLQESSP